MIVSSQRVSAPNDTFEFEGGFDPSPKTNVGLREVFAPAVQPSRREREFKAWQAEGRSGVTRREVLRALAPAALATTGFVGVPTIRKPKPPIPPAVPALTVRDIGAGVTCARAKTGSFAAARLQRQFDNKSGIVRLEGQTYNPLCLVSSDKATCLFLRSAA